MQHLIRLDRAITNRIRICGRPEYGFWKFLAGQSIVIYVLVAVMFTVRGELSLWHFVSVFVLSYIIAVMFQHFIRRQRPNFEKTTGYKMWIETYSFPSAHATVSSAAASALGLLTSFSSPTVAVIAVLCLTVFALLIGLSRIVVGVHYFGDVLVGWILGDVIALGGLLMFHLI